jgi:quercetin dioxygenase-like cupin family protein
MPVIDTTSIPEIQMRVGVSGKWLCDRKQGASSTSVLRNWVEPGITIPRHRHDQEEIVLVERGTMWVEIDGVRHEAGPGQTVIIPARAVHAWGTLKEKIQIVFVWPESEPFAPGKSTYLDGSEPPKTA